MSCRPPFQLSDPQAAPWSLILHHSYSHSFCFAKFPARSPHSQVLKGGSTLAFGWLCATMSSAVSSFTLLSQLLRNSREEQVERDPSCPFIMPSVSKKKQVQNYTFNVNFELTTSKGKQLPTATSLLYSLGEEGSASWFWEKKQNTSFSYASREECQVNHTLLPNL